MYSSLWKNELGISANKISSCFTSQLKFGLVDYLFSPLVTKALLIFNQVLYFLVNSILYLVFPEISITITHRFKCSLVNDLFLFKQLLLFLHLLFSAVGIWHVFCLFEKGSLYFWSWISTKISRLGLNSTILIPFDFLDFLLFLLNIFTRRISPIYYYEVQCFEPTCRSELALVNRWFLMHRVMVF